VTVSGDCKYIPLLLVQAFPFGIAIIRHVDDVEDMQMKLLQHRRIGRVIFIDVSMRIDRVEIGKVPEFLMSERGRLSGHPCSGHSCERPPFRQGE
jgi:hypothetical protein